jgi:inorganic triphosphatase YgiF
MEVELKLALPMDPGPNTVRRLAQVPLLAGSTLRRQKLLNVYYDTPDRQLLRRGMVLRLRRVGTGARATWLQTLKTSDGGASALSRRGEWESPLDRPELSAALLQATPWSELDPHGTVFAQLQPCFSTEFTRARWTLPWTGGSVVEVALDLGRVAAGGRQLPICEFELELKTGQASSLFEVAHQLAQTLPLVPSSMSKSERGYALAGAPPGPTPVGTPAPQTLELLALSVLQGAFRSFTTHLITLRTDADPELVHQARVAWRRFRCARRLFGSLLPEPFPDVLATLQPLLDQLGAVRDLEVAKAESLPPRADAYVAGDPQRARAWQRMLGRLDQANTSLRRELHQVLDDPSAGQALIQITQWLDALADQDTADMGRPREPGSPRAWALRKMRAQRRKLRAACAGTDDAVRLHQVRILAKRLRYGVDALRALLPPGRARRWHTLASRLQAGIGLRRDAAQAAALVARIGGCTPIAEFLRGHVAGSAETMAITLND